MISSTAFTLILQDLSFAYCVIHDDTLRNRVRMSGSAASPSSFAERFSTYRRVSKVISWSFEMKCLCQALVADASSQTPGPQFVILHHHQGGAPEVESATATAPTKGSPHQRRLFFVDIAQFSKVSPHTQMKISRTQCLIRPTCPMSYLARKATRVTRIPAKCRVEPAHASPCGFHRFACITRGLPALLNIRSLRGANCDLSACAFLLCRRHLSLQAKVVAEY